jgi:serine acetyltransferase
MICGNITIGNDILIVARAFVYINVSDRGVVIGNQGVIHYKGGVTEVY